MDFLAVEGWGEGKLSEKLVGLRTKNGRDGRG